MSSRLFQEVREKKALCYEIGSSIRRYRDAAAFVVNAGVDDKKLVKSLEVILGELGRIKAVEVGEKELKRAKEYYKGQLSLALEDTMSAMLWYGEKAATGEKEFDINQILKKIDSIKAGEISRAASSMFTDGNLNLAVIGPIKERRRLDAILHIK